MPQYRTKQHQHEGLALGVVGGRDFDDYDLLAYVLDGFGPIACIVSGGARGADSVAETYADNRKIPTIIHKPDWERYGKSAGMLRNAYIVRDSDEVVAFWDGKSKGTANTIQRCKDAGKPIHIIPYNRSA